MESIISGIVFGSMLFMAFLLGKRAGRRELKQPYEWVCPYCDPREMTLGANTKSVLTMAVDTHVKQTHPDVVLPLPEY